MEGHLPLGPRTGSWSETPLARSGGTPRDAHRVALGERRRDEKLEAWATPRSTGQSSDLAQEVSAASSQSLSPRSRQEAASEETPATADGASISLQKSLEVMRFTVTRENQILRDEVQRVHDQVEELETSLAREVSYSRSAPRLANVCWSIPIPRSFSSHIRKSFNVQSFPGDFLAELRVQEEGVHCILKLSLAVAGCPFPLNAELSLVSQTALKYKASAMYVFTADGSTFCSTTWPRQALEQSQGLLCKAD